MIKYFNLSINVNFRMMYVQNCDTYLLTRKFWGYMLLISETKKFHVNMKTHNDENQHQLTMTILVN